MGEDQEQEVEAQPTKREFMDKQSAFGEYKKTEAGRVVETRIMEQRDTGKMCKIRIKDITKSLNVSKANIDQVKMRIDRKEEERKMRNREDQLQMTDAFNEDAEEIIDEEEL